VLNDARQFFKEATVPAGLWGLSMGGAFASHAVAQQPQLWQMMIIVSSFDSLMGVIEDKFATYSVPMPSLAKVLLTVFSQFLGKVNFNDVSPMTWAQQVKLPVLIVHGDQDKLIVIPRGKRLYESFAQSLDKRWLAVEGAGHNDILISKAPLYAEMSAWFLQHSGN
jgi:pimeloyl-ACP methyl ester carboxylesterase